MGVPSWSRLAPFHASPLPAALHTVTVTLTASHGTYANPNYQGSVTFTADYSAAVSGVQTGDLVIDTALTGVAVTHVCPQATTCIWTVTYPAQASALITATLPASAGSQSPSGFPEATAESLYGGACTDCGPGSTGSTCQHESPVRVAGIILLRQCKCMLTCVWAPHVFVFG